MKLLDPPRAIDPPDEDDGFWCPQNGSDCPGCEACAESEPGSYHDDCDDYDGPMPEVEW